MRIDPETCRDPDLLAGEVRRLLAVIESGQPTLTDEERDVLDRLAHDASYQGMVWTERVLRGVLKRLG